MSYDRAYDAKWNFLEHADNLNPLLVKEKELLSCCQVFSIEENLEPAGYVAVYHTLLFIPRWQGIP